MTRPAEDGIAMKKTVTWILVADGTRARIFRNDGPSRGLRPALDRDFVSPAPPTRAPGTDRPGRVQESANSERHAMVPRVDWHRFAKEKFARSMAKILDGAAERDSFDRLVLVAPPRTLGDLRSALGQRARGRVTGELDRDLTHVTAAELPDHLYRLMPL